MNQVETGKPVCIDHEDLIAGDVKTLLPGLREAFGDEPDCLGIVLVDMKSVPEYSTLRKVLLSYSSYLAALPPEQLTALENVHSKYVVGWSHGKEKLKSGAADIRKGSYYVNPTHDAANASDELKRKFPEYTDLNLWPPSAVLPGFREAFEKLGRLIVDVGTQLAKVCDEYATAHVEGYQYGYLQNVVKRTSTTKARLLHYFPPAGGDSDSDQSEAMDSWCGEHVDHSAITGLTPAMFVNEEGLNLDPLNFRTLPELEGSPDPDAGLYIRARSGKIVKVAIPKHCLAFQTGEALEIATAGKLRAVPHLVRASNLKGIARNTLAVFIQNDLEDKLGVSDETFAQFASRTLEKNLAP